MAEYLCADAGSAVCPCFLAEAGDCIQCSLLRGEELCHCRWSGVCIGAEFGWRKEEPRPPRPEVLAAIIEKEYLSADTVKMSIRADNPDLTAESLAGRFVLVRAADKPVTFNTPMAVMAADPAAGTITILAQVAGPKTKALAGASERVWLRGPYPNGLLGAAYLERLSGGRALLVARGVCQAVAVPVARQLRVQGNQVSALIDPGQSGRVFIAAECGELRIPIREGSLLEEEGMGLLRRILAEEAVDLIFSGGSDAQHKAIRGELAQLKRRIPLVVTNNNTICCGEGICGSCQVETAAGQRVRTCKTRLNPADLWG